MKEKRYQLYWLHCARALKKDPAELRAHEFMPWMLKMAAKHKRLYPERYGQASYGFGPLLDHAGWAQFLADQSAQP